MMARDLLPEGQTRYPPEPPLGLYNKGHVDFVLESQNKWVLDVDAWFRDSISDNFTGPRYYVELSFTVTCSLGS